MKGKEKCKALKEIRSKIASENDIAFAVSECSHQGDCLGTCPKCEAELRYLERELALRKNLGKTVAVFGLSTGICTAFTACSPTKVLQTLKEIAGWGDVQEISGDILYDPEDSSLYDGIPNPSDAPSPLMEDIAGDIAIKESFYEE